MKKMTGRFLSMLLALAMCTGLPAGAASAEGTGVTAATEETAAAEAADTSESPTAVNKDGTDKITYILLVGLDNNYAPGIDALGDSDGLVIVSLNETDHTVALTSILRDTVFNVAGHKGETNKVTLIYHTYGLDTLVQSIENDMGITFDNYLAFNYLNIVDLVDAVGGIDTEVYPAEIEVANAKLRGLNRDLFGVAEDDGLFTQDSGTVHMTGKQAVVFMRVRLDDETRNDFGRTERERRVILLLKDKFMEMNTFKQIAFVRKVVGMVDTNMSVVDALKYANNVDEYRTYDIRSGRIPQDKTYYSTNAYIHMNIGLNRIFFFGQVYGENGGMPADLEAELAAIQADNDAGNDWKYYI